LILSSGGRQVSSLLACPLALYPCILDAQVGQESIGETHQMQVYNCGPIGSVLLLAQPQQLLQVFHRLLNGPAVSYVRITSAAESSASSVTNPRILRAWPLREKTTCRDPRVLTSSHPVSEIPVAGLAVQFHRHERRGAAPSKQIPSIAACLQLLA
jgi:hypothetical protein